MSIYTGLVTIEFDDSPSKVDILRKALSRRTGLPLAKLPSEPRALVEMALATEHSMLVACGARITGTVLDADAAPEVAPSMRRG